MCPLGYRAKCRIVDRGGAHELSHHGIDSRKLSHHGSVSTPLLHTFTLISARILETLSSRDTSKVASAGVSGKGKNST